MAFLRELGRRIVRLRERRGWSRANPLIDLRCHGGAGCPKRRSRWTRRTQPGRRPGRTPFLARAAAGPALDRSRCGSRPAPRLARRWKTEPSFSLERRHTVPSASSFADFIRDWQQLIAAYSNNAANVAAGEPLRPELEALLSRALELKSRQENL